MIYGLGVLVTGVIAVFAAVYASKFVADAIERGRGTGPESGWAGFAVGGTMVATFLAVALIAALLS